MDKKNRIKALKKKYKIRKDYFEKYAKGVQENETRRCRNNNEIKKYLR